MSKIAKLRPAAIGIVLLLLVAGSALLAPWLAPYPPLAQDLSQRLLPPVWMKGGSPGHLFGTDHLGRDMLSRVIYGSRVSLLVGLVSVLISGILGTALGLVAGYYPGKLEALIMLLADVQMAFPFMLLALAVMAVLGSGLQNVVLMLGITGWVSYGRLVRVEVLSLREKEFVEAARALGQRDSKIILRHILPNLLPTVMVIASLRIASMIIAESSLTFMGLGVEPDIPTWGSMLADGRGYITTAWWVATFPGLAIMLTVLGINLLGDWLRDELDPKMRNAL